MARRDVQDHLRERDLPHEHHLGVGGHRDLFAEGGVAVDRARDVG